MGESDRMTPARRAYHASERERRHTGRKHRRSALVAAEVTANENVQHGYSVTHRGDVVFTCRCVECDGRACECIFRAFAEARRRGGGVVVYGPGGRVLQRRESAA